MEKIIIIGSGIAGLTAAIYAGRAQMQPLVISGFQPGGQLTITTMVENFPGFPDGILGPELIANMRKQAEKFGARFKEGQVKGLNVKTKTVEVITDTETIETVTIIIATGATARWLNIPGEAKFRGRGVHTCATCDGFFYKGKELMVIGGGDSACEEALFLTKFAEKVHIVHRREEMRASKIMQERVKNNPKIDFIWNTVIEEFKGDKRVESVVLKDVKTGEKIEAKIDGVFLAIGYVPETSAFKDVIDMDKFGYIETDSHNRTNIPGVFASGDVRDFIYRQAVTAAGSGCKSALAAERFYQEWLCKNKDFCEPKEE
jgi:thioredoxin reductase (NADPH)